MDSSSNSKERKFPSFSALRAFEQVMLTGSFKEAAIALCLSTSAVSHQIRLLERDLGKILFVRHAHGAEATVIAIYYLQYVRAAFDHLHKGTIEVRQHSDAGSYPENNGLSG